LPAWKFHLHRGPSGTNWIVAHRWRSGLVPRSEDAGSLWPLWRRFRERIRLVWRRVPLRCVSDEREGGVDWVLNEHMALPPISMLCLWAMNSAS
jgi:hypothetical protein